MGIVVLLANELGHIEDATGTSGLALVVVVCPFGCHCEMESARVGLMLHN